MDDRGARTGGRTPGAEPEHPAESHAEAGHQASPKVERPATGSAGAPDSISTCPIGRRRRERYGPPDRSCSQCGPPRSRTRGWRMNGSTMGPTRRPPGAARCSSASQKKRDHESHPNPTLHDRTKRVPALLGLDRGRGGRLRVLADRSAGSLCARFATDRAGTDGTRSLAHRERTSRTPAAPSEASSRPVESRRARGARPAPRSGRGHGMGSLPASRARTGPRRARGRARHGAGAPGPRRRRDLPSLAGCPPSLRGRRRQWRILGAGHPPQARPRRRQRPAREPLASAARDRGDPHRHRGDRHGRGGRRTGDLDPTRYRGYRPRDGAARRGAESGKAASSIGIRMRRGPSRSMGSTPMGGRSRTRSSFLRPPRASASSRPRRASAPSGSAPRARSARGR